MPTQQSLEWLDYLFVEDVGELERLGNLIPRTPAKRECSKDDQSLPKR